MSAPARQARAARPRVQRSAFWWAVSKAVVLAFTKLYFRLRVEGREQVPPSGPLLLVANHTSYLDPPLVGITAGRWVGFLAQAGLARVGPLRWWMAQMGVTLIDRDAPSKEAMRLVAEALQGGEAVGIYPEGTRSRDGSLGPFRTGVEFLVRRTGATVVPVGIDGAFRAFPRGALLPRPRRVVVRYGAPWSAERVLAPGGVEALRRCIAELARAPLGAAAAAASSGIQAATPVAAAVAPMASTPAAPLPSSSPVLSPPVLSPTGLSPSDPSSAAVAPAPAEATDGRVVRPPGL